MFILNTFRHQSWAKVGAQSGSRGSSCTARGCDLYEAVDVSHKAPEPEFQSFVCGCDAALKGGVARVLIPDTHPLGGHQRQGEDWEPPPPPPRPGPSFKEREGKGKWQLASTRRQLQTRTTNPRRHANPPHHPTPSKGAFLKCIESVSLDDDCEAAAAPGVAQPPNLNHRTLTLTSSSGHVCINQKGAANRPRPVNLGWLDMPSTPPPS